GPISVSAALGSPRRIDRARSAILSTSWSCTARDTSSPEPALRCCPGAANAPASTPLQAASRSASSKTRCADLPPSSSRTPVMLAAAAAATCAPTAVEPVNAILSTSGWAASALPTAGPNPGTTLHTPRRADRGGAGERDLVHVRVGCQRLADRGPEPGHHVEHPRREPGLVHQRG